MDKNNMAFIILNMLFNVCMLSLLLIAFKRKDKKLFCIAWALYGISDIYWSLSYIFHYDPMLSHAPTRDALTKIIISSFQCLLGSLLIIAACFLYRKKNWSYQIIRTYCYVAGSLYVIFLSLWILIMIYLIYAKTATMPGLQILPGTCNLIISIMFIVYSIKYLNTIRPAIKEKIIKRNRTYEKEEIACPECANIIPVDKDICSKCNWTYADNKGDL